MKNTKSGFASFSRSRRNILKMGALGIASLPSLSGVGKSFYSATSDLAMPKIGLQLYTVRNEIDKDIRATLKKVSKIGFKYIESAFFPDNISIEQAGKLLKDANLKVFSSHIELPVNDKEKENMLKIAEAYNCKKMVWHGWPEDRRYKTEAGTLELVDIYNEANHFATSNGLSFGIHNHWWEYEKQETGQYPYEILLKNLSPDIFFEIDTYWVTVAGHNPAEIIRKFGSRAPMVHIKDGPARYIDALDNDEPDPMTALGTGVINIPAIAEAGKNTIEWMIVELDVVNTDVYIAIQTSYNYLIDNKFAL